MKTKIVFLGGYLGAGKTTLAFHVAKVVHAQGKSVSVVLNDQGNVLVDTQFMRNAGVDVSEVVGACFCTKFDEFVKNARGLVAIGKPDVILAEPIGTSTSLMSSVIAPMKSLYKDEFQVSPLFVVVDGPRALAEMEQGESLELGTRKMIPIHQMHEAEVIVISKTDLMSDDERRRLIRRLKSQVTDADLIEFSSIDRRNIDEIVGIIDSDRETVKLAPVVDQRFFSAEKSTMGWYSVSCKLASGKEKVDIYDLLTSITKGIANEFKADDVAHVKVLFSSPKASAKISLVEGSIQIDDLKGGRYFQGEGEFVLNSRVRSPPQPLQLTIERTLEAVFSDAGMSVTEKHVSCFIPKPDSPKYAMKS
jgi:G3E family GTPase